MTKEMSFASPLRHTAIRSQMKEISGSAVPSGSTAGRWPAEARPPDNSHCTCSPALEKCKGQGHDGELPSTVLTSFDQSSKVQADGRTFHSLLFGFKSRVAMCMSPHRHPCHPEAPCGQHSGVWLHLCSPVSSVQGCQLNTSIKIGRQSSFQRKRRVTGPPAFLHFSACHVLQCVLSESKLPP